MDLGHKEFELIIQIGDREILLDKHNLSHKGLHFWSVGDGSHELADLNSVLNL